MGNGHISDKQLEILNYIKAHIQKKNYPPTVREICEAVKLKSTSSVHAHLETLEKNGYIARDQSKTRAIEIINDDTLEEIQNREIVNVPMVGSVAAGIPLLAEQNITDYFPVPADILPDSDTFILKVKGDSMINVGIYDGDMIFVKKQHTAYNGEIIVALVDDSATVKRFYKETDHIRLQPENDTMEPIIVDDCLILGKVVGLFRTNIQ